MSKAKLAEIESAAGMLKNNYGLVAGSRVYVSVASVSESGMSRTLRVFIVSDGQICNVTHYVGKALGWTVTDNKSGQRVIRVNGGGMDMSRHLVECLAYALHGEDEALKYDYL